MVEVSKPAVKTRNFWTKIDLFEKLQTMFGFIYLNKKRLNLLVLGANWLGNMEMASVLCK